MLKSAVSDYIDRIVGGRGLRQRVITQPRPKSDIGGLQEFSLVTGPKVFQMSSLDSYTAAF